MCLISFIQTFKYSRHFDKLNRNTFYQKNDEQNTKRTWRSIHDSQSTTRWRRHVQHWTVYSKQAESVVIQRLRL